jgi:WD40 repeat protein
VSGIAFSPDGRRLAALGTTVTIWDAANGQESPVRIVGTEPRGQSYPGQVAFSPDGSLLAVNRSSHVYVTGTADGVNAVRQTFTVRSATPGAGFFDATQRMALSPNGNRLAAQGESGTIRVYEPRTGQELYEIHAGRGHGLAYSPDGRLLASAGADGTVKVWDATAAPSPLAVPLNGNYPQKTRPAGSRGVGIYNPRESLALSPDGQVVASRRITTLSVRHVATGQVVGLPASGAAFPPMLWYSAVAHHPREPVLAVAGGESADAAERIILWDTARAAERASLPATGYVTGLAFSADGRLLAVAGQPRSGPGPNDVASVVELWDYFERKAVRSLRRPGERVGGVALSADGRRLLTVGVLERTGHAVLWDTATGEALRDFPTGAVFPDGVALSPDARWVAHGGTKLVVWDAETGQVARVLRGHGGRASALAFAPDGRLATLGLDRTLRVWELATGEVVLVVPNLPPSAEALTFSPDGRRLACIAVASQNTLVWDAGPFTDVARIDREAASAWRAAVEREAMKDDIARFLRESPSLTEPARRRALEWLAHYRDDPQRANRLAWQIVARPGGSPRDYGRALRLAVSAARLAPDSGPILNTLGVAQYRAGGYAEAAGTLARSAQLNHDEPGDLAFLAMAQHQLGAPDAARATLARVREALKQSRWSKDSEAQAFLAEAEALIDPTPTLKNAAPR